MGNTRQSANLVSDNNIFVDIVNDRVGIGSTLPTSKLDIVGDINFTGSLYQNEEEFVSGGGESYWSGTEVGIHTLSNVGVGTTNPRFNLEVGSVGTSGTSLYVNGDARITGILSVGQGTITIDPNDNSIKLSTDTVIRRDDITGDIRFLDESGNLKKIIANEVRVGSGDSAIVLKSSNGLLGLEDTSGTSISILGDGGSSGEIIPTIYDDKIILNDSGWNSNTTYSCCSRTAGGKKGNTFFFARLETSSSQTRMRVYPFTVNRSTGEITWQSASNVWLNTSGSGFSTTYFTGPDGTGAIFAGGHNVYPGNSSYTFGYSKFIVNANGTLTDNTSVSTGADHGYNGNYFTLPTAINTGLFPSAGYNANASSRAHYRQHTMNGSSISVGSLQSLSSDTSTSYSVGMIAQPGVFQTGAKVCGFIYFRINASNYRVRALAANGSFTDHAISNWDSQALAFQMTNGDVILYSSQHVPMRFTAHNSKTDLTTANAFPGAFGQWGSFVHFGLGNNEFVLSLNANSSVSFNIPFVKSTLNSTTGFSLSGVSATTHPLVSLGMESSYAGIFPLYANSDDANPDKLLVARHFSSYIRAKVIDFPTFTAIT
jgi:hypothetical protein